MNRKKWIGIAILVVLVCLVIVAFAIVPPGYDRIEPYKNKKGETQMGSIAEKKFIEINGVKEGMFLKGRDKTKPVLLYLNGGPGISDYFLTKVYPTQLEEEFVVCYWDYPGTGLSFHSDFRKEELTTERYLEDAILVTEYLQKRFHQEQIYLMGHSFGTAIGIQLAKRKPEYYKAYIAMSQISDQLESEKEAYNSMKKIYSRKNNKKMVKQFEAYAITEPEEEWLKRWFASSLRDNAMHELGVGTMHDMHSVISGIFFPLMRCRDYTIAERINIWRGKAMVGKSTVSYDRMKFKAINTVPELQIPIYFLAGKYDLTCSYSEQYEYFKEITAPVKKFYTFEHSAHSPLFEQPDQVMEVFRKDIIKE
ncbi:hydrolase, alpha/beta fold family [Lachnospiraceae bacterium KM106-2]|nr:hydrolase, alpha/beta fold family [Lachnospiraceae bacterium KM106-2]